jgi:cyclopropane fatty-acyl-phospholipid synthase-like methyltransferase
MGNAGNNSVISRARRRTLRVGRRLIGKTASRPTNRHSLVGRSDLWAEKRRFQFEFLSSRGMRPEHRLLDIGCGTLRGGIPLIEYLETGHYAGIEARGETLDEGRKELAEAGLEHKQPLLICAADPSQLQFENPIDIAWAFSVLIHMPDEVVNSYMALVARVLGDGGEFYANVSLGERPEYEWQGFPVVTRRRESYQQWAAAHGLSLEELGTLETLGHQMGSGDHMVMLRFTRS